jgi:hypothetical protein
MFSSMVGRDRQHVPLVPKLVLRLDAATENGNQSVKQELKRLVKRQIEKPAAAAEKLSVNFIEDVGAVDFSDWVDLSLGEDAPDDEFVFVSNGV